MQSGVNCKLTAAEVEQAVKIRCHELCRARAIPVPANLVDFLNRAAVHWAGGCAMITWEQ